MSSRATFRLANRPFAIVQLQKSILQFCLLTILVSCLTPVEVSTEILGGKVVISGQITPIADTNIIQIGTTAFSERLPEPISDATVTLHDDLGNIYNYEHNYNKPGTYKLNGSVGIPGHTYFIRVIFSSGAIYESAPERMPDAIGSDFIEYEFLQKEFTDGEGTVSKQYFIDIYADTEIPVTEGPLYLRWNTQEVYVFSPTDFPDPFGYVPPPCYIDRNPDPQRITIFNGNELKATSIKDQLVASRVMDFSFHERHYFTVYHNSMSWEAYEYWRQVDIVANQTGSIFDSPPAKIKGNVFNVESSDEEVHGYVQVANQNFNRFYTIPSELPIKLQTYCLYSDNRFFQDYPEYCLDCLRAPNSSYERPDWF